ncbi:MAG: ATP-binding cassette domain-containing protein [Treponema sp.]|jgi:D-methionine transport system ATP-binding protein|nr:ATP-binding cassette domain-containing protein [Treponema sp.]
MSPLGLFSAGKYTVAASAFSDARFGDKTAGEPLFITLKGVSKRYAMVTALTEVDLTIPPGSIFGIIGKSGAGKSTLLRIMSLLESPDRGEVYYGQERVDTLWGVALRERQRNMGMIFQNFNLMASRNVSGNIAYPLEIAGLRKGDIHERVEELLELVDITDKRKARLRELSGGQKQRVAIARALAVNPEVLFCDEATSALDPLTTRSILSLIRELREKLRITVVLITHQMEVIRAICEEVAVLNAGQVAERGTVRDLFANPRSMAARELLHGDGRGSLDQGTIDREKRSDSDE